MPDLWGIDDEKEARRIRKETAKNTRRGQLIRAHLLIGFAVVVITITWVELFNFPPGWPRLAFMMMAMALGSIWQNRRISARLPETLKKEGRCTKCGYDLKENVSEACPECGERTRGQAAKSN